MDSFVEGVILHNEVFAFAYIVVAAAWLGAAAMRNVVTTTKDVEVKSRRVIVFEDDKQAIVLKPPGK